MRMLSIHGPWAQLIALGFKDVENRGWSTDYRGPLAVHCSKTGWRDGEAVEILAYCVEQGLLPLPMVRHIRARMESDRGKIIGVADVVGCSSADGHASPWAIAGNKAIELANARTVMPIDVRGGLGLLNLAPEVVRKLAPRLAALAWVPDVIEANDAWGANCGPTAIAAALALSLEQVREAVSTAPGGTFRGYMGVRDFQAAIPRAGGEIVRAWSRPEKTELLRTDGSPIIVLIRFCGPWDHIPNERVRARVQATHRHAFCYRRGYFQDLDKYKQREHGPGWVFDCNNLVKDQDDRWVATWLPLHAWRDAVLPELVTLSKGTGETAIDWMAQVRPRPGTSASAAGCARA